MGGNLLVTKWVYAKHHGLGLFFKDLPCLLSFQFQQFRVVPTEQNLLKTAGVVRTIWYQQCKNQASENTACFGTNKQKRSTHQKHHKTKGCLPRTRIGLHRVTYEKLPTNRAVDEALCKNFRRHNQTQPLSVYIVCARRDFLLR